MLFPFFETGLEQPAGRFWQTEGTVWGIDSYDQWGVELGKQLAKQITPAFHDDAAKAEQDASTQALIEFYRAHRK